MSNYRSIQQKAKQILFPAWEQNIPSLGTKYSHVGNKTGRNFVINDITAHPSRAYGSSFTTLRLVVMMLLMLVLGVNAAWGQTDYSGTYYIKSNNDATYYLCTSTVFYDGNHYANSGDMPYLTTATTGTIGDDWDKDAVWRIIKAESGNYYYVVHAVDGKYLTYNDDPTTFTNNKNQGNRLSLHLQYLKDEEYSLFIITKSDNWYNITPKTKSTWSLNPAGDNYDTRAGTNNKTENIPGAGNGKYVGGLIGLWLYSDAKSKWQFEAVTGKPVCDAPIFTNNGSLSISCSTTGANIYYTTDGSTIPTTSSYNGSSPTVTEDINVIWARATTQDSEPYYWSPLSVYVIPQCATPVISIVNGKLNLSCATEGVTIYYTINGSDPTTEYNPNNKPDATENDIIKAVATKNGYHKSNVASILPSQTVHNTSEMNNMYAYYILASDFTISSSIGTEAEPFCGVIDGGLNTFSGFDKALVAYANGATIKNVILDNVTIGENANGYAGAICCEALGDTRIYNCGVKSGTISGTNAGSIVGKLDGNARVINCYSFATVSGGTWGAGIVGYNSFSSTRSDLRTMVMNCMFYGEISSNSKLSPIYGGEKITNVSNLNGYNYYRFDANYSKNNNITDYNCALAAEENYLTRFEFFRNTLNSNRELAAWYATDNPNDGKGIGNACKMAKWVLDPADKPYPILKAQDYYPSFINYEDAPDLGTISLTISESNTTAGGKDKPDGASINSNYPTTLTVYDKDLTHKHFNYRTVRLPYYNEVGTGNCTHNKVVTGWKITGFSGGTQGHFVKNVLDYSGTTHGEGVYPPYNFADRYCTDKDKYDVSGRVFSQGAYYDVPEGVTGITIEPYWGTAVYLSDPTYDVAYPEGYGNNNANAVFVSNMGSRYVGGNTASINDDNQTVYTDYASAFGQVASSGSVYDNAIVLVGNYHHYWGPNSPSTNKAFTIMSADLNNDCEPDYSFIVQHGTNRQDISAIRFDFINSPGLGMIQKVETDGAIPKHGIWCPKGWFEVTNTTLIQFTQFEYDKGGKSSGSPLILLGGIYDQFVTARYGAANSTEYIHLGSNVWMKEFCNGTHTANTSTPTTRHIPISVTGGEFESFYLTGTFRPSVESVTDNAECYINGGKFGDMAGAGQEQLKGDVTWLIDHADITNFYGGGINDQKPVTGNIYVEINNSQVGFYCGGPKFGNMQDNKKVTTKAKGSTFGNFYGAGYGGTSYFRDMTKDKTGENDWDTWNADYTRKYVSGKGISTEYECEFIPFSGGESGQANYVGRFYVLYASLSLAETKNVESTLEDCHITGSFYGGGKLGSVDGSITSTLKNCTIDENVFGAGFSASVEKVNVVPKGTMMKTNPAYNESVGVFTDGVYPDGVPYTWTYAASVSAGHEFDDTNHLIYTTTDLTTLGAVTGSVILNIEGTTTVGKSVYGGGEESGVGGDTEVNVKGGTITGSVFGGGEAGIVKGSVAVNMTGGLIQKDVYGGGALADTQTNNWDATLNENQGGWAEGKTSASATTTVRLTGGTIVGNAYGGGLGEAGKPAYVWGDVLLDLNGTTPINENTNKPSTTGTATTSATGCVVRQVFGCNNVNGSPKGDVMVHIYATQNAAATQIANTTGENPVTNAKRKGVYDVHAVYGGGNLAAYNPVSPYTTSNTSGSKTQVIIEGCSLTSIETVYGGGNAAAVPETNVEVRGTFEIGYVFGGGNGKDDIAPDVKNPGADVGTLDHGTSTYGTGNANTLLEGGLIHEAYGGSNTRGVIKGSINQTTDPDGSTCDLDVEKVVGAGKYADIDGDVNMTLSCQPNNKVDLLFAGADEANVNGNITLNITNGHFGKVFGGNNLGGAIKGKITVNVEETGCQPIKIDNLYLGSNEAAYSVYGYYISEEEHPVTHKMILKPRESATDARKPVKHDGTEYTSISDFTNYPQPELNIISCTYIGKVFGGGLGTKAKMYANPTVNVNMVAGDHADGISTVMNSLGLVVEKTAPNPDNLGIIGDVFGGGDAADIEGNTTVNIAVEYVVKQVNEGANVTGYYTRSGAGTTADPFVYTAATGTADEETTYYEKKAAQGSAYIIGSVFGGGNAADVLGNTNVTMSGGYVFNGIFGGGYAGNVGKFTRSTAAADVNVFGHTAHEGCIGKPISCAEGTGKCTVLVNGGQIGPISVATEGMNRSVDDGGPVPEGWVWGAGQGLVEDPATYPDTHFKSYVGSTDVTIGGTAFVLESIIGGGEFGRVLGDTKVTITGNCQIGVGEGQVDANNKPIRYTDAQFVNPLTTPITNDNALAECSHFPYGQDTNEDGIKDTFLPYDPYYDKYKNTTFITNEHRDLSPASTASPSDGKTWIGCVFAGGSGYMPYEKEGETGYDWCSSAGLVEGNTNLTISGGHILTNVYGGNEVTNVKGTCKVTMTGGTIGVPRTVDQIINHPLTCYLFGAGKGDPRPHFNTETNVGEVEVEILGGTIYGSVFGGGEDGHVERDVKITIGKDDHTGPIIGTWGTSYVDGNIFGGGRGFAGDAYTAGNVAGCVDLDIKGGNILGSVYGGGRLGSVGYGLYPPDAGDEYYGAMRPDYTGDDANNSTVSNFKRGYVDVEISGGTIGNSYEYIIPSAANTPSTLDFNDIATWTDENWKTWKNNNNIPLTEFDKETYRLKHTKGGNVFTGGMGRLYQLDGITPISAVNWWKVGCVKQTKLTVEGGTIKSNVYGGGELGAVKPYVNGGTVQGGKTEIIIKNENNTQIGTEVKDGSNATQYTFGSVYGGGYGSTIENLNGIDDPNTENDNPKFVAGLVYGNTKIDMQGGKVLASVYGGGEVASVNGSADVAVSGGEVGKDKVGTKQFGGPTMGNVYGGGSGHPNIVRCGRILHNTKVTISGDDTKIYHNVYGGGAYGTVGDFEYTTTDGKVTGIIGRKENTTGGNAEVTITGGTIGTDGHNNGMVFGSSRGDINKKGERDDHTAWVYDTFVTIGTSGSDEGPAIKGSIYGSGENGHTFNNADVKVHSGTIGVTDDASYLYRGNVYGGGCGTDKYYSYTPIPTGHKANDGEGDKYNPLAGIVYGNTTVTIDGGTVVRNVYGAGAMGSVGKKDTNGAIISGGTTTINVSGGTIGVSGTHGDGNVYGAARGDLNDDTGGLAEVQNTEVNIIPNTIGNKPEATIKGSVFGGGEAGIVKGSVAVSVSGGNVLQDVYGGGALANTNSANWGTTTWAEGKTSASNITTVNLTGGKVTGNVYGGGLGKMAVGTEGQEGYEPAIEAKVYGNTTVELNNGVDDAAKGCIVKGSIFGCNNMSGSPQGTSTVHIYKTQREGATRINNTTEVTDAKVKGTKTGAEYNPGSFDVKAVYGGGNLAAYQPVDLTNVSTNVIIDGCDRTSICQVYGGGNAASTPATSVTINGTYEIGELFGGGNGKDDITKNGITLPNPGANVGYKDYSEYYQEGTTWKVKDAENADTKEERLASSYVYGTGVASVNVFGGLVHRVFGGSNTKGNVRKTAVTLLDENSGCPFCVDEAYGGGKNAPMDAEAKLLMSCIPGLDAAYGGAEAAAIQGNVTLNITNGTFDRVFGGNNLSGTISGSITVNIEEVGCKPIIIGELYGGGNQAGYSVYGYDDGNPKESGTRLYDDPQVNVKSFTSIGNIYGGGYGEGAKMVGNPTVNINETYGRWYNDEGAVVAENAKTTGNYPIPSHAQGKMGAINNVFGGGNAAKVIGNTNVNIATLENVSVREYVTKDVTVGTSVEGLYTRSGEGTVASPYKYTAATGNAVEGTTYYEEKDVVKDVLGVDIRGNVYGGGNNAEVTGNTNVTIGKKNGE